MSETNHKAGTVKTVFTVDGKQTIRYTEPGSLMYSFSLFTGTEIWTGIEWQPINEGEENE